LQNFGDVRALLVTTQPSAHRGAIGLVGVYRLLREKSAADATRRTLLARGGECVNDGDLGRARFLHGA
jgi:hypothetical protein